MPSPKPPVIQLGLALVICQAQLIEHGLLFTEGGEDAFAVAVDHLDQLGVGQLSQVHVLSGSGLPIEVVDLDDAGHPTQVLADQLFKSQPCFSYVLGITAEDAVVAVAVVVVTVVSVHR